jgi:acetylornithine aminotransferase
MNLFDVYPLYSITPVKALDCTITDENGVEYLDLYGGHGVISIGHPTRLCHSLKKTVRQHQFLFKCDSESTSSWISPKLGKLSGLEVTLYSCAVLSWSQWKRFEIIVSQP